ncbi:MAG: hypothetical protein M1357_00205 [Candidatus Marsarchaeota archaeon]|nr:hypothetical protein [Candidatus Marsarchaeota archaeon]
MNEIRLDPLTREWVIVAPNRDRRPISPKRCPFCVGSPEINASEQVQILQNKYAALTPEAPKVTRPNSRQAYGFSEIVVESLDHNADFCTLPLNQAIKVFTLALRRSGELLRDDKIKYVHFFRNRGRGLGVSIRHPHSQIVALPFVPPRIRMEKKVFEKFSPCVLCDQLKNVVRGARLVKKEGGVVAYVPYAPRWPYEIHIQGPHEESLRHYDLDCLGEVVRVLQLSLRALDQVLGGDTPYTFSLHDAPKSAKKFHTHLEITPVMYDRSRVKFTGGMERGAGTTILDRAPEERARELRAAIRRIE